MNDAKRILMVAQTNKVEALRMASGLTLLDDQVQVAAWGGLPDGNEAAAQMEALDFADVPVESIAEDMDQLAMQIVGSDVVFFV